MKLSVKIKVNKGAVLICKFTVDVPVLFRKIVLIHSFLNICLKPGYIHVVFWVYISEFWKYIGIFNPRTIMSDKEMSNVHEVLRAYKTKEPKIVLQRAEEIFPSLKEGVVSGVCMK
jgi:hypothetical protein